MNTNFPRTLPKRIMPMYAEIRDCWETTSVLAVLAQVQTQANLVIKYVPPVKVLKRVSMARSLEAPRARRR